MRMAASVSQDLQLRSLPRGARITVFRIIVISSFLQNLSSHERCANSPSSALSSRPVQTAMSALAMRHLAAKDPLMHLVYPQSTHDLGWMIEIPNNEVRSLADFQRAH